MRLSRLANHVPELFALIAAAGFGRKFRSLQQGSPGNSNPADVPRLAVILIASGWIGIAATMIFIAVFKLHPPSKGLHFQQIGRGFTFEKRRPYRAKAALGRKGGAGTAPPCGPR